MMALESARDRASDGREMHFICTMVADAMIINQQGYIALEAVHTPRCSDTVIKYYLS